MNIFHICKQYLVDVRKQAVLPMVAGAALLAVLLMTLHDVSTTWTDAEPMLAVRAAGVAVTAGVLLWLTGQRIMWGWIDTAVLLWGLYMTGRAWAGGVYPCWDFGLKMILMAMLYVSLRMLFSTRLAGGAALTACIVAMACYEAVLGGWQMVAGTSRHHHYMLTGTFFNPGPYAAYLAMGVAMACQWMKTVGERRIMGRVEASSLLAAAAVVCALPLPSTWSRAAFVALAVSLAVVWWRQWRRYWPWVALAVTALAVGAYLLKQGSADGRGVIFRISALCVADNPWTGSGIGSFFHHYAEKTAQLSSDAGTVGLGAVETLEFAFNDVMLLTVEQGLAGLLLAGTVIVLTAVVLWRRARPLAVGLLTLLTVSLFSYPLEQQPYQILTVAMVAYAASQTPHTKGSVLCRVLPPVCAAAAVVAAAVPVTAAIQQRHEAVSDYASVAGQDHSDGTYNNLYYELLPEMQNDPRFLFDFAKMMAAQQRWNDSNDMLRRGTLVSNDPMFHVLQGHNLLQLGDTVQAEQTYWKAYHVMPNRLYPLYCLTKLYEKRHDTRKMTATAKKLLEMQPKITSPATRDMKKYATKILKKKTR